MNVEQAKQTNQAIHDAIQATAALSDDLEGHVLMGWVAVAEWMDGTGKRWLSRAGATRRRKPNVPRLASARLPAQRPTHRRLART